MLMLVSICYADFYQFGNASSCFVASISSKCFIVFEFAFFSFVCCMVPIYILCWSMTYSSSALCLLMLLMLNCRIYRFFVLLVYCSVLSVGYCSFWCCLECLCVVFDVQVFGCLVHALSG